MKASPWYLLSENGLPLINGANTSTTTILLLVFILILFMPFGSQDKESLQAIQMQLSGGQIMTNKSDNVNDWQQPFEPLFLVDIDSDGGNIGRFYWQNQSTFIVEQWGENDFYEKSITTVPGYCAWLFNYACWVGWCMGGFCH